MTEPTAYMLALANVLRSHRKAHGWTRDQLRDQLADAGVDLATQTLATYELATRQITVDRLAELASVYRTTPGSMLTEAEHALMVTYDYVAVDLARLAKADRPDMAPMHRWARIQMCGGATSVTRVRHHAIDRMAELCGMDSAGLLRTLIEIGAVRNKDIMLSLL